MTRSQASGQLRGVLAHGIAFHNSHLDREERRVIEEHFRKRDTRLRVIVATTTLAMGVNTPASAVVIVGLEHPSAEGPQPYSVAEYKNLVGRAGRLGYAERGASYLIATSPREENEYWQDMFRHSPKIWLRGSLRPIPARSLSASWWLLALRPKEYLGMKLSPFWNRVSECSGCNSRQPCRMGSSRTTTGTR